MAGQRPQRYATRLISREFVPLVTFRSFVKCGKFNSFKNLGTWWWVFCATCKAKFIMVFAWREFDNPRLLSIGVVGIKLVLVVALFGCLYVCRECVKMGNFPQLISPVVQLFSDFAAAHYDPSSPTPALQSLRYWPTSHSDPTILSNVRYFIPG